MIGATLGPDGEERIVNAEVTLESYGSFPNLEVSPGAISVVLSVGKGEEGQGCEDGGKTRGAHRVVENGKYGRLGSCR